MLDERPPEELPARASAMAGARATLAQNNSVRIMRQFGSRLAIAPLAQSLGGRSMHVDMVRAGAGNSTPKGISWRDGAAGTTAGIGAGRPTAGLLDPPTERAQVM